MATAFKSQDLMDAFSSELAIGVDAAVEHWMAAMDAALNHPDLTTLGRMYAAREVLAEYKRLTGKTELQSRRVTHLES